MKRVADMSTTPKAMPSKMEEDTEEPRGTKRESKRKAGMKRKRGQTNSLQWSRRKEKE